MATTLPTYWWTGTKALPGTTTPEEGWIPITTNTTLPDLYSAYLNPTYADIYTYDNPTGDSVDPLTLSADEIRDMYGITYGDPYATTVETPTEPIVEPPPVVPEEPSVEIPIEELGLTAWADLTPEEQEAILTDLQHVPPQEYLPENYEWKIADNRWYAAEKEAPPPISTEEVDITMPDTYWSEIDSQINAWREWLPEALSGLDLNYSDQQAILDALTDRILGYESPDLSGTYSDLDALIARLNELSGQTTTADTAEIERLVGELEALSGETIDVDTTNLQSLRDQLIALANERPDIDYSKIQEILSIMEQGPNQDEAFDFVARSFGFGSADEYFTWLAEQRGLTRADMQGLSDQEKAEYDRMMRQDMANQERIAQTQMEAVFADTGSAIQYMAAADEANQRLTNTRMQYQFEQMNQNIMLQSQELEQKMQQYGQMVQQGQMSALQYMDMRRQGYEGLLNGYLSQAQLQLQQFNVGQQGGISALTGAIGAEESRLGLEQNARIAELQNQRASLESALAGAQGVSALKLEADLANVTNQLSAMTSAMGGLQGRADLQLRESAQDLQALSAQFDSVYNSMMIQTGINTSILQTVNQAWETTMAPLLDGLNALLAKENLDAQDAALALEQQAAIVEKGNTIWQGFLGLLDVGANVLDAIIPG